MTKPVFDPYRTIINIMEEGEKLVFGLCFRNPSTTLILYKQHMYSLFLLLYCYGEESHKEMILDKIGEFRDCYEIRQKSMRIQHQKSPLKKMSKTLPQMLDFVQTQLKIKRQEKSLHTLKQRQYIRKAFKQIFQMQQKLTQKSEMNIIDFAKLAASLIDAHCQVKDYYNFQTIQFKSEEFDQRKLDVFIQIDKREQSYRYIKQNRNPNLVEDGGDMFERGNGSFMFQKIRIKRAESISEGFVSGQQSFEVEEEEEGQMLESIVAESIKQSKKYSSIVRIPSQTQPKQSPPSTQLPKQTPTQILPLSKLPSEYSNNPDLQIDSKHSSSKPPNLNLKINRNYEQSKSNHNQSSSQNCNKRQQQQEKKKEKEKLKGKLIEQGEENGSEGSETRRLDLDNLNLEDFENFEKIQKEIQAILEKTTLSQFLKGFEKKELQEMPLCFHTELVRKIDKKFSVELLDSAMQDLALENLDCQSPTSPKRALGTLTSSEIHQQSLLNVLFKTLFNQESNLQKNEENSKLKNNSPLREASPKKLPTNPPPTTLPLHPPPSHSHSHSKSTPHPQTPKSTSVNPSSHPHPLHHNSVPNSSRSNKFLSSTRKSSKKYNYQIQQDVYSITSTLFSMESLSLFQRNQVLGNSGYSGVQRKYRYLNDL